MMKSIIMLGPQGSGKGTQAKLIAQKLKIPHLSTGDVLREAMKKGTEMGKKAKELINAGKLVPDKVVNGIVRDGLKGADDGYILDGYPRNLSQAKELDKFADINYVIELLVPDDVSVERIVSRRTCKACGEIFGAKNPPKKEGICDVCGEKLYQRDDDKEEAVRERLRIYHEETEALLDYYRPKGVAHQVDGTASIDEVNEAIMKVLSD